MVFLFACKLCTNVPLGTENNAGRFREQVPSAPAPVREPAPFYWDNRGRETVTHQCWLEKGPHEQQDRD